MDPQFVARPVDIRLHGAQRQVQDTGDLLVGMPFHVPQQDAGAVLGSQPPDGALDGAAQLARLDLLERVFAAAVELQGGRGHLVRRRGVGRPVDRQGVEVALAQVIDRRVVRDLEDPGGEPELRAVAGEAVQHLDERFLRQVLGEGAVAHHAIHERKHRSLVAAHQLAERRLVTLLRPLDEILVAGAGQVGRPIFRAYDAVSFFRGGPGRAGECGGRRDQAGLRPPDVRRGRSALRPPQSSAQPQPRPPVARRFAPLRAAYLFYFRRVLPAIGRAVSKHRDAYTYLPESVKTFPEPEALAARMRAAGFADVRFELLAGGICAVHHGTR